MQLFRSLKFETHRQTGKHMPAQWRTCHWPSSGTKQQSFKDMNELGWHYKIFKKSFKNNSAQPT